MRSLHARLIAILVMLVGAALASTIVMLTLFNQSTVARIGQATASVGRSCGAITQAYRFYTSGWQGAAPDLGDAALRQDLAHVVFAALRDRENVEGGLWQAGVGAFAYAFPTYEGETAKTDVPAAELSRIVAVNKAAQADDQLTTTRVNGRSQTLLLVACPLPGPIVGVSAWAMTRVFSVGTSLYWQLVAGLGGLLAAVLGASALVVGLLMRWSRHVRRIELALAAPDSDLPELDLTGERELDRIVSTLNGASRRLQASRREAERLGKAAAQDERLAAIGRITAGVAHEIRSPIAAMRLNAELALRRPVARKDQALGTVIEQVDRLDGLVAQLLAVSEREPPQVETVELPAFLQDCATAFAARAADGGRSIEVRAPHLAARFDPAQMRRAVACLLTNALQEEAPGAVLLTAGVADGRLAISVADAGPGPPPGIQDTMFDPFVTGRPEGTGLGLSIVREVATAHEGAVAFERLGGTTVFSITIPCPAS